ncbi:hypothetical protein CSKR_100149, partial [Clonorchis sinensis]
SLDEATQKLKDAEMKTKQHLSENLLKTLQYLKGQITSYLSALIATITQKISSLLENQEEAKAVAANYLQRELPKLKGPALTNNDTVCLALLLRAASVRQVALAPSCLQINVQALTPSLSGRPQCEASRTEGAYALTVDFPGI